MALCRCSIHGPPKSIKYEAYVKPLNYPNGSLICGIKGCENAALVWLEFDEIQNYKNGIRVFDGPTQFAKVRVDDSGYSNKRV